MLTAVPGGFIYAFSAMASPCEIRNETTDEDLAVEAGHVAETEALRIEWKYSRYREDSELSRINQSNGERLCLDAETAALIDYAAHCFRLSGGRFDVTSGVLRRIWRFDGSDKVPSPRAVKQILPLIGFAKLDWRTPHLTVPRGMEIDLGGVAKEYAVDSALSGIAALTSAPVLVNFGGDLRVSGPRAGGIRWRVSIESVDTPGRTEGLIELGHGALTTSGDARRFLLKDGVRYSHILDPRTGWPVEDPPRSVTVAAATCMEAGILSTMAMLHGRGAEKFLKREGIQAWWMR